MSSLNQEKSAGKDAGVCLRANGTICPLALSYAREAVTTPGGTSS